MENRPIRPSMKDWYFKDLLENKLKDKRLSKSDTDLIITFISKKIMYDHISASNRTNIATFLYQFRARFMGDTDYKDITVDVWENAISGLLMSDYKESSKNAILGTVRIFIIWGIENKKIKHLPLERVKAVSGIKVIRRTKTEKDLISNEEVYTMLSYPNISPKISALVAILYWTGCRLGEALSLRWSDLEFNPPILEVKIPPYKVNPERYVPTAEALPYLANWRNHYPVGIEGGAKGDNFVFVTRYRKGENYKQMNGQSAYISIRDLSDKAIGRKLHPHQFRASDITNKLTCGISDTTNKMIHWGHVGTNMLDVYFIPNKDMIKDEILQTSGLKPIVEVDKEKPMMCPVCHKMNIGVKFCSNCGTPISRDAIKEKALVDEETARINREHSPVDMLGAVAKELGIEPEKALEKILSLLKTKE